MNGRRKYLFLVIQSMTCIAALVIVMRKTYAVVPDSESPHLAYYFIRLFLAVIITGLCGGLLIRYRNLLLLESIREGEHWENLALESNQERDIFLINTSHEVNKSLNEILESTGMLLDVGTDVQRMEDFYYIHQTTENVKRAIQGLLQSITEHMNENYDDSDDKKEAFYQEALQRIKEAMDTSKKVGYQAPKEFICPEAVILVVDDNDINLEIVINMLEKYRCKIIGVTSGAECLKILENEVVDLVFLDYMMPEMDGIETLKKIRKMPKYNCVVPVVVLTADAQSGAKEQFMDHGFDDYMKKPVELRLLGEMLRKYLLPEQIVEVEP